MWFGRLETDYAICVVAGTKGEAEKLIWEENYRTCQDLFDDIGGDVKEIKVGKVFLG